MTSKKKMGCFVKTIHITWKKNIPCPREENLKYLERKGGPGCGDERGSDVGVKITGFGEAAQELDLNSAPAFNRHYFYLLITINVLGETEVWRGELTCLKVL